MYYTKSICSYAGVFCFIVAANCCAVVGGEEGGGVAVADTSIEHECNGRVTGDDEQDKHGLARQQRKSTIRATATTAARPTAKRQQ